MPKNSPSSVYRRLKKLIEEHNKAKKEGKPSPRDIERKIKKLKEEIVDRAGLMANKEKKGGYIG